jgi:peptidoglycan/xylan/chitin deacetylase (PgdA/CDA1 family)
MQGTLVISLDFELQWGVPEKTLHSYGTNLLGERLAVPGLLGTFGEFEIHATWAAVGLLFAASRAELIRYLPVKRPAYANRALDPYPRIEREIGADEEGDPYHFAASLLREIASTPHQEIASHTFSHYYCLEPGQDLEAFEADLAAAAAIASSIETDLKSIVFPRNQVNPAYLGACRRAGINAYRGNLDSWLYRGRSEESLPRRVGRLLDSYIPLSGDNSYEPPDALSKPLDIPASRFLRPWSPRLRALDSLRLRRITADLTSAAKKGRIYHLWWHPHNFGANSDENFGFLRAVLRHFDFLRNEYGMRSLNMGELASELIAP